MPYELFWHGKPSLYYNYLDAYNKKQKEENEMFINRENFKSWLQGYYVDVALKCNHPLAKKNPEYLKEPVSLDNKEESSVNKEKSQDVEKSKAIAQFMAFGRYAEAFNKNFKENGG